MLIVLLFSTRYLIFPAALPCTFPKIQNLNSKIVLSDIGSLNALYRRRDQGHTKEVRSNWSAYLLKFTSRCEREENKPTLCPFPLRMAKVREIL